MKTFWGNIKKFILSKIYSKHSRFQTAIYLLFLILLIITFQIKFNKDIPVKIDSKSSQKELDELFEENNQELSVLQTNQIKTETEKTKVTPDTKSKTLVETHKADTALGTPKASETFARDLVWWKEFIVNYYKSNNLKLSTESFKKLSVAKNQQDLNKFMNGEVLKFHQDKGGNTEDAQNIIALRKYVKESANELPDQQKSIAVLKKKNTLAITPPLAAPQKSLKVDDLQIEVDTPNKQNDVTTPQAPVSVNSITEEALEIASSEKDINKDEVKSTISINTSDAKSKIESELETRLINAEYSGNAKLLETIVDKILEKDSDLNGLLKNGDTVLIMCVRWDLIDMVEKLLEQGANPNIQNKYGKTALMFAARYGRTAITEKLLQKGANPNLKDEDGQTSLMKGVIWGYPKIVEKLLEQGANPNVEDRSGSTPLIRAVSNGYTAIVEKLLEQGANTNLKDEDGKTALSIAIRSKTKDNNTIIKIILTSKKTPESLNELVNSLSDEEKATIAKPISEAMNLLLSKNSALNAANNHKTLNEIDYSTAEKIEDKLKGKGLKIEEISNAKLERLLKLDPVVALYNIGDAKKQAVFKPVRFDDKNNSLDLFSVKDVIAELVAYKISQKIGFPNIPETKIVKIDGKIGSLQDFVVGDIDIKSKEKLVNNEIRSVNFKNQLDKLKIFSFVFAQWDLGADNMIVNYDNGEYSLSAIDNGNIWNPQKVQEYGQRLFVKRFNLPKHNTSEGEFPFASAQTLNEEAINKIIQFSGNPERLKKILEKMNENKYVKKLYVLYQKTLWIYYPCLIKPYVENFDKAIAKDIIAKLKDMQQRNQIKEIVGGIVTKSLLDQFPISKYEKQDVFNTFNVEYVNTVNERLEMALRGLISKDSMKVK